MKLCYESLLSEPDKNSATPTTTKIERPSGPAIKISEDYLKATTNNDTIASGSKFSLQYAHIYAVRLWATRPILEPLVKEEWTREGVALRKIAELCESTNKHSSVADAAGRSPTKKNRKSDDHEQHLAMREDVVVALIGTLFKQQPEKPSILQELVEDNPMAPVVPKSRYISSKDTLLLEDETTRVQLVPKEGCGMSINSVPNGIICAVKGKPTINGKFEVEDVIFATPKPSVWPQTRKMDVEMVFVSGLLLGSSCDNMSHLDLLFDYLQGLSGCPSEHETNLKIKTRLFIVGDSFGFKGLGEIQGLQHNQKEKEKDNIEKTEISKKLDGILDQLSQTMEVFILPGPTDPAEPMFPQTPIHRCILPLSSRRPTFHSLSNPTRLQIPINSKDTVDIILTGGQSIVDAMKNTSVDNAVEMSTRLLEWGHLCPTAPDTLALHPGIEDDLFVVKKLPNLFVVGGQTKFGLREWKGTYILTLPKFAETGVAVVLDKEMNIVPLNIKLTK